ncbi:MAG: thioredoxin domain-containing protein [Bacteroidota bacterium]
MMLRNILSLLVLMSLLGTCGRAQEHEVLRSKTLGGKTGLNHLAGQQSPYLLQHARNPVDWYPWGDEALEKAKTENKLLIISVGYAACHWCHVMEHESFEDSLVAARMNEHFVSIKVDREERPDIDDVYMTACQLTNRRGCGWPLNAIALPDGRPVWAGTYFPKDQWIKVLERFTELRLSEPGKMEEYAAGLTDELVRQNTFEPPLDEAESLSREQIDAAAVMLQAEMDFQRGGTRGSPKFPIPVLHEFLLRHHFHTGNEKSLAAVTTTLDAMAAGGIYDQLAGGFARYSTDADWLVPHFEKMLYDNAQLVSLYAHAYQLTGKERYAEVVRQTLDFIDHDLTDATGVFYASLDADTEGEEGTTYVWSLAEVETIAPDLVDVFGVTERGNWEGQNILTRKQTGLIPESAREKLLTARRDRPQPGLDDKALTAWNALMITGYADAYRAVGERVYRERAVRAGEFLWTNVRRADGRLDRNYKDGKSAINAFLEDYALLAQAYVDLYQITFAEKWLTRARELVAYADAHFYDETTGLYRYTSDLDAALVSGNVPVTDEVIPAGNSAMARVRHQLGVLLAEEELTAGSRTMLGLLQDKLAEAGPRFYANWASLYLELLEPTYEVAILGADAGAKRDLLSKGYLPHVLLLGGEAEGGLSLLRNKLDPEQTTIYVCLEKVCQLPVTEVEAALRQLRP